MVMELNTFLQSNESARKIFGKRELVIIEKQLFGVNLTQSEKNRLSRDIRKKLKFIQQLSRFNNDFELKKGAEIKKLVNESKEIILEDKISPRIKRVFLYGSAINNALTLNSDIDIAIELDDTDVKEATLIRKRLLGKLNQRIDLQVYNVLPEKIKKEIETAKQIYASERKS